MDFIIAIMPQECTLLVDKYDKKIYASLKHFPSFIVNTERNGHEAIHCNDGNLDQIKIEHNSGQLTIPSRTEYHPRAILFLRHIIQGPTKAK